MAMDIVAFEQMLSAAFHGGEYRERELRLAPEEAEYLRTAYPAARVKPMQVPECSDRKNWFEVSFV